MRGKWSTQRKPLRHVENMHPYFMFTLHKENYVNYNLVELLMS